MKKITNSHALVVPATPPQAEGPDALHDIKPPVDVGGGWAWVGWLLGAALLAAALWAWRHWRRKQAAKPAPTIVIPPHLRARQRLREAEFLLHDPKRFCILVSDVLRVYLEERFDLHAPERTTEEFLDELQDATVLTTDQKLALADFLQQCDLVKFARHEPTEQQLRELLNCALRLIDETQFVPAPPAASVASSASPAESETRTGTAAVAASAAVARQDTGRATRPAAGVTGVSATRPASAPVASGDVPPPIPVPPASGNMPSQAPAPPPLEPPPLPGPEP